MFLNKKISPLLVAAMIIQSQVHVHAEGQAASSNAEVPAALQEVIVTARKVGERLQDVPLSILAMTDKDLTERGITSLSDLSLFTPGLSYSADYGRTSERPVIRGVSALRPEAPQPVSVFVNGVFVRDAALGLLLDDARRIEVIKGPQSALYGRSTYAGAINYITEQPGQEKAGKLSVTIAGDGERSVFGAVTVPISETLSARIRAKSYEFGGQYMNSQTGNKLGNERTRSIGTEVLYKPSPRFDAVVSIDYAKDRDGMFAAVARPIPKQFGGVATSQNGSSNVVNGSTCNGRIINIVGNNPVTGLPDANVKASASTIANGWPCGPSTHSGTMLVRNEADLKNYTDPVTGISYGAIDGLDRQMKRSSLTMNWNLDNGMTVTSQTAYTSQRSNLGADQSYDGTQFAPGYGYPGTSWLTYDRDKLSYGSQELRLVSKQGQALTWLAGAFYYKEDTSGTTTGVIAQNAKLETVADTLRPKADSKVEAKAIFGRVQYAFGEGFKVSAEGRYNEEKVEVGGTPLGTALVSAGTCTAGQVCYVNGSKTFKDFAPRLTADYKLNKDTLLYGQWAKGTKSGGFNSTAGLPLNTFTFDGETITAVELGVKSEFMKRRLRVNFAVFQNNISDLQLSNLSLLTNPFTGASTTNTVVNNVGEAHSRGYEVDVVMRATSWLTLSGNYAFTDARALKGTEVTNGTAFGGNMSVAGAELPRSPRHSAALSAAIDVPTAYDGVNFFARTDVMYQSRRYAEIQNLIWADAFTHVNASMGLTNGDWRVTFFVKNATNNDASLNGFRYLDPLTFRRTAVDFLPRLRQYGITVNYGF